MSKVIKIKGDKGISLFVAVIVTMVASIMSLAISRITVKEVTLTQANRDSQIAFYASNSGIECALYGDLRDSVLEPPDPSSVVCGGSGGPMVTFSQASNPEEIPICVAEDELETLLECWEITFDGDIFLEETEEGPCFGLEGAKAKFEKPDEGGGTTEFFKTAVESRGYNTCDVGNSRRVERALRVIY
jgi:hypothetical protein